MDPSMQGPPPGAVSPEMLEEMMAMLEQAAQGLAQMSSRLDQLTQTVEMQAEQINELTTTLGSAMSAQPDPGAQQGGW